VFNVGGGEVLVILLVVLIVLGPDKLPDTARKVGNVMGEIRRMSAGFQNEMRAAMDEVARPEPPKPSLEPVADEPMADEPVASEPNPPTEIKPDLSQPHSDDSAA
jgi:sec-independent protein translocase protein TatB